MRVSVVIPTIRKFGLLEFELPSLANQTMNKGDYEIVLVDDYHGREGEVKDFCRDVGLRLRYTRSKPASWRTNAPIGNARNTGLILADGELVVFIDDFTWVPQRFLETHYNFWKDTGMCLIAPAKAVEEIYRYRGVELTDKERETYERWGDDGDMGRYEMDNCPGGWLYTCNASAPLEKIVEVNGFWEIADCTREEDVLMGLALERAGVRFAFRKDPNATVQHLKHDLPHLDHVPGKYKKIDYEDLGWQEGRWQDRDVKGLIGPGKCGLDTPEDYIQLITRDVFDTQFPGSWALIERFKDNPDLRFNEEIGFDLGEMRRRRMEKAIRGEAMRW
ncbi:MAG: glycosyltransferase family 2 protein [Methanoculleus sp.]